jgi:hypothetical protein
MRVPAGRAVDLRAGLDPVAIESGSSELRGALPGAEPVTIVLRGAPASSSGD